MIRVYKCRACEYRWDNDDLTPDARCPRCYTDNIECIYAAATDNEDEEPYYVSKEP